MSASASITGRWRITEMDNWDQEAIDLVQPGFIEFGEDRLGALGFIAVTGELDCRDADRDGQPGVEFSWQGSDDGDDASGRGWAALNPCWADLDAHDPGGLFEFYAARLSSRRARWLVRRRSSGVPAQ